MLLSCGYLLLNQKHNCEFFTPHKEEHKSTAVISGQVIVSQRFESWSRCARVCVPPPKLSQHRMCFYKCTPIKSRLFEYPLRKEYHLTPVGRCEADLVETRSDYEYFYSYWVNGQKVVHKWCLNCSFVTFYPISRAPNKSFVWVA